MKTDRPSLFNRVQTPVTEAEAVEIVALARPPEGGSINDVIKRRLQDFTADGRPLSKEAKEILEKYAN